MPVRVAFKTRDGRKVRFEARVKHRAKTPAAKRAGFKVSFKTRDGRRVSFKAKR